MPLLYLLHLLNFLPWWGLALKGGRDWKAQLPFLLASGVLFQFTWVSPCWLYFNQIDSIAGIPYGASCGEALAVYIIGVGIFNATWLVFTPPSHLVPLPPYGDSRGLKTEGTDQRPGRQWPVNLIAFLCLGLALLSYQLSGMPFWKLLNPFDTDIHLNLYGMQVQHPILEGFADSLVPAAGLALLAGAAPGIGLFIVAVWVMMIAGFRYRLILLALSLFFFSLMKIRSRLRPYLISGTAVIGAAGILLLTVNRSLIASRSWWNLGVYGESLSPSLIVHETNNCQTFMACLASPYRQELTPDGGNSMHWQTLVRVLPRGLFPERRKPWPGTLLLIRRTYNQTPEGKLLNPALSCLEEYYLSAGILGLALGMALLGWLCAWLGRWIAHSDGFVSLYAGSISASFLFQIITRGYVPQQVELALYLAVPFGLLYLYDRYARPHDRTRHRYST